MTADQQRTILVTGASGFIGSVVAARLEAAGHVVRRGVRRPVTGGVLCDLDRAEHVATAVQGADLVVHAAYGDATRMAQQCQTLLCAMNAAGVSRLIHLSSIAVYGDQAGPVDERTALRAVDSYGEGKIACEDAITKWVVASPSVLRRALVLRPGIVYGRGSPFWIDKMVQRIRLGAWGTFGEAGEGTAALVHVDDVAELIVKGAGVLFTDGHPDPDWRAPLPINVVGPETPSWNAYFQRLATAAGVQDLPVLRGSSLKLRQVASVGAKIWKRLGLPGAAALTLTPAPGEVALFSRKADYRTGAAHAVDFVPRIGLDEGLRRSLAQENA